MRKKRSWYSFEGLTPGQKIEKARTGVVCALAIFALMNMIAFLF